MKKFLFLLVLGSMLFFESNAQVRTLTSPANIVAPSTGNSTITINLYNEVISFIVTYTKSSGTVAGTAVLQGSHDGVTYYTIPGAATFTLTDVASQGTTWVVFPSSYPYYRISTTTSGASTIVPVATAVVRNPPRRL